MHAHEMISAHPQARGGVNNDLIRAIEVIYDCQQVCTVCADACLGEEMVADLVQCIRLNQDCADVCLTTGLVASRRTGSNEATVKRMLEICAETCRLCETECRRHAEMHEHCRICADSCRSCEEACRMAAGTITPTLQ